LLFVTDLIACFTKGEFVLVSQKNESPITISNAHWNNYSFSIEEFKSLYQGSILAFQKDDSLGESRGFDAGKRIKGIKRHIIVDTLGMVLAVVMQGASIQDRDGATEVISKLCETWNVIIEIFADNGYLIGAH